MPTYGSLDDIRCHRIHSHVSLETFKGVDLNVTVIPGGLGHISHRLYNAEINIQTKPRNKAECI